MNDIILMKQGEIILKGQNKREFERKLISNIKRSFEPFGKFNIYSLQSTIYVEPIGNCDMESTLEVAQTIFGVLSVTRAAACKKDKDEILKIAEKYLEGELNNAKTFKVESKRADKRFPMSSIELSQFIGGELHNKYPHLKPDMYNPEFTVHIEVRDLAAYIHGPALAGAGGLPVGTGGKMITLLSGGIDSPVASYMMAKRGVQLIPVHFYSFPYTSVQAKEKVETLTKDLQKYCGRMRVIMIPFTHIQEEIRKKCPEGLLTVIMRRFMMRIAEQLANHHGCSALVTGDNLGQVASQTAEALSVSEECVKLPVFRPLIAFDKKEIVDIARKINTFDTSIQPFEDCCTVFTPQKPRTKPKLYEVLNAEVDLDIDGLVAEAIELRE
ncbi:MAG: tRNA 4-thiouridine(8) synthase ThiI [Oscillospiraceae bacterium]|jgi:thiamine biosynthesis protein ThiI|nr:tRNA 4-thiouridine(8) synthase ThiI [Oscillospiraceae bacterium]